MNEMHNIARYVFTATIMAGVIFSTDVPAQMNPASNTGVSIMQSVTRPDQMLRKMSLLDPERFSMRNSYSMSFSSMNGSGSLIGTYINSMEYRFNSPVIMRMKVAYQSQTGHLFGNSNAYTGNPNYSDGRVFIPSFDLIYQPFKNTTIGFFYRDYSMYQQDYYGYGYGRNSYSPLRRMMYGY